MHDRMQYPSDPRSTVMTPWKSEIPPFSKAISYSFIMGAGKWPRIL